MTDSKSRPNSRSFPAFNHEIQPPLLDKTKATGYGSGVQFPRNLTLLRNFLLNYLRGIDKTDDGF